MHIIEQILGHNNERHVIEIIPKIPFRINESLSTCTAPPQHNIIVAYRTLKITYLPLELDNEQLSVFLKIIECVMFAPLRQLKTRHILCWNVLL